MGRDFPALFGGAGSHVVAAESGTSFAVQVRLCPKNDKI